MFVKFLHINSLLGWWLTLIGYEIYCGVRKLTFASMDKLTPTTIEIWKGETLKLFKNNPCIRKNLKHRVVLRPFLLNDRIFEEITVNGMQTCSVAGQR